MFNPWPNHSTGYAFMIPLYKVLFCINDFYFYMPLNIDLLTFKLVFFVVNLGVCVSED